MCSNRRFKRGMTEGLTPKIPRAMSATLDGGILEAARSVGQRQIGCRWAEMSRRRIQARVNEGEDSERSMGTSPRGSLSPSFQGP